MKPSRRTVLSALASLPLVNGCERVLGGAADALTPRVPGSARVPTSAEEGAAHHLLSRASFGPRPGEAHDLAREGLSRWIDRQLEPETIPDEACRLRARRFETPQLEPGMAYEFHREVLRAELTRQTLLQAVYSERQLLEVMVSFWSDHLNIDLDKGECVFFKPADDRSVVRAHALGRFEALVRASVTSPAMLLYLDGAANVGGAPGRVPNENHARELLELHTLGVHGGYQQHDVSEAARCLTGWRVKTSGFRRGTVSFDPSLHDDGPKRVLGVDIPPGLGAQDVDRLVQVACAHPATSRHLATKLARRFVCETPPPSLVDTLASTFTRTQGDLRAVLRALLTSPEFAGARGQKVKTPFRLVVSALRGISADTHAHAPLLEYLGRMGQGLFEFPTPDGYPQSEDAQASSLLWRWGFGFSVAQGQVPTVGAPIAQLDHAFEQGHGGALGVWQRWAAHLFGRPCSAELEARLARAEAAFGEPGLTQKVGLLLASPEFQRC